MVQKIRIYAFRLGVILSTLFVGGYAIALRNLDEQTFTEKLLPIFSSMDESLSPSQLYEFAIQMRAWFAMSLFIMFILLVLYFYFHRKQKEFIKFIITIAMGLTILIGTNLIAYPIAFFFFLSAIARLIELKEQKEIKVHENQ